MKKIALPQAGIATLFGSHDANLKHIESLLDVRLSTHGNQLIVDGDREAESRVQLIFDQLQSLLEEGYELTNGDVKTAAGLLVENTDLDLRDYFLRGGQKQAGRRRGNPKRGNQRPDLAAIERVDIVFRVGPARGGKNDPPMAPAPRDLLSQNTTSEQMKMFLTRLGFGSKAVVTGDITQIDLPTGRMSGLVEALKIVKNIEGIAMVYFDEKDVVRHKLVQQIVKAYEAYSNGTSPRGPTGSGRPQTVG